MGEHHAIRYRRILRRPTPSVFSGRRIFSIPWYSSEHEHKDKESFVRELLNDMECVVDHAVVGNHLWTLLRVGQSGRLIICLNLMKKQQGRWFHKQMNESMCPRYYDCPLWLLRAADEPGSDPTVKWRKAVEKWHEEKAQARKRAPQLVPGMVVEVDSYRLKLIKPLNRRGWVTMDLDDHQHKLWRMTAEQARRARVIQQPSQESSDSFAE